MKNLLIIRHALTELIAKSDKKRKLTGKGMENATALGIKLRKAGIKADIIVSSHAVRAETTARLVARGINYPENAVVSEKLLYHAYAEEIISFIRHFDDRVETLVIVGHNPALLETVNLLGTERFAKLPPGHAVKFQFDVASWEEIGPELCSGMTEMF